MSITDQGLIEHAARHAPWVPDLLADLADLALEVHEHQGFMRI